MLPVVGRWTPSTCQFASNCGRSGEVPHFVNLVSSLVSVPRPKARRMKKFLRNSEIAELLGVAAESAKMPLQKALRRASRKAVLWPEEAALMFAEKRPLIELAGVGPHLSRIISAWIEEPPLVL